MCFILSDLKCYGSVTSSSRNHFWSANDKEQWKIVKKISFPTYKTCFFSLLGPLLVLNLIIFLFLFILDDLKCSRNGTWSSTNHFWTLIVIEQHTKNFLSVWKLGFVVFGILLFFFEFLTPFMLGGHNFLISNLFSMIISVSNTPRGGVQVLFEHPKQQNSPLGSGLAWALKCSVTGWSTLALVYKGLHLKQFVP